MCQSDLMKYYQDGKLTSYVGVDISKYQDYVDFLKLKKAGVDFVMLRVGARGYGSGQIVLDDYFTDNIKRATDAGLRIGVYFTSQAITEEEAIEEANVVLENIKDYKVTYPVAFDMSFVENDTARIESVNRADKTKITKAFLDTIAAAGYKPLLYGEQGMADKGNRPVQAVGIRCMAVAVYRYPGLSVPFYHVAVCRRCGN